MTAEETAVAAFLSFRLGELEREQKRLASSPGVQAKTLTGSAL
jgi:hypothetical protein